MLRGVFATTSNSVEGQETMSRLRRTLLMNADEEKAHLLAARLSLLGGEHWQRWGISGMFRRGVDPDFAQEP